MNLSLSGKKALVCGSTQGIGKAIAQVLANQGASIVLMARNEGALQETLSTLDASSGQAHSYLVADFSQPEIVKAKIDDYLTQQSAIHILINNTGGPAPGALIEAKTEDLLRAYHMHLLCNQLLTQAVVPGMKAAAYGRIIQIISTSVKEPIPGLGVSNTTRGAVASWAKTLSGELGPFGITVNNILPGFTATQRLFSLIDSRAEKAQVGSKEMAQRMQASIPLRRFAAPEEIAYAAAFLASPSGAYVNGVNLPVDGGKIASL